MAICCNWRGVWTEHPHTSHFLMFLCTHNSVARDIGSRRSARVIPSMFHVVVRFDSLRLSTPHSSQSLSSSTSSSWSSSSLSMWVGSERSTLCASANEEPDSFVISFSLLSSLFISFSFSFSLSLFLSFSRSLFSLLSSLFLSFSSSLFLSSLFLSSLFFSFSLSFSLPFSVSSLSFSLLALSFSPLSLSFSLLFIFFLLDLFLFLSPFSSVHFTHSEQSSHQL